MLLKIGVLLLSLVLTHLPVMANGISPPILSESVLLINADNGTILFQKNGQKPLYPASITKLATALYVLKFHSDKMNKLIVAKKESLVAITSAAKKNSNYRHPAYWLQPDAAHIGIKAGEEFYLKDLFAALMIASANDAANVIAEGLEGSIPKFMDNMNLYLKKIGCQHSYFLNPHGLHHPDHKTSALDMALIAKEALRYPYFRDLVKSTTTTLPQTNLTAERYLLQTNLLLRSGAFHYKKAIGIKTGTTNQAGKTLVAAAKDKGRTLIAVVLGSQSNEERYQDAIKLFEAAFQEPKMRYNLLASGPQKLSKKILHGKSTLQTYLMEPLFYEGYPSEKRPLVVKVEWFLPSLPIEKGALVGKVVAQDDQGKRLAEAPLYAAQRVAPTLLFQMKKTIVGHKQGIVLSIGLGFIAFLLFLFIRGRRSGRGGRYVT